MNLAPASRRRQIHCYRLSKNCQKDNLLLLQHYDMILTQMNHERFLKGGAKKHAVSI